MVLPKKDSCLHGIDLNACQGGKLRYSEAQQHATRALALPLA